MNITSHLSNTRRNVGLLLLILLSACRAIVAQPDMLRIDPMMLVSVAECTNITHELGGKLFPGWEFDKTPVLLYRPGAQEVLINYPHLPKGFSEYHGFTPVNGQKIYFRNGQTTMSIDDQNTSTSIEDVRVLVVADPYSRERNNLRPYIVNPDPKRAGAWLDEWGFIQSPYDELGLMLHEAFHVFQDRMAPAKRANEPAIASYPVLDATNNALYVLEASILRDALSNSDEKQRLDIVKKFAAVRAERVSHLSPELVEYENGNEFVEGLAKYIEYRWKQIGSNIKPVPMMWYRNGFEGYAGKLGESFRAEVANMRPVIAVDDDRWGANRYGAGPLRFKLYEVGAAEALLLDTVAPDWKEKIWGEHVYLADLLSDAVHLTKSEQEQYLASAKEQYKYADALGQKQDFEREGRKLIAAKLAAIRNAPGVVVRISYSDIADDVRVRFTPFGVTQVGPKAAIYELVPIGVLFSKTDKLLLKQVNPVLIDKAERSVTFALAADPAALKSGTGIDLDTPELTLTAANAEVTRSGNEISVVLKKPQ